MGWWRKAGCKLLSLVWAVHSPEGVNVENLGEEFRVSKGRIQKPVTFQ